VPTATLRVHVTLVGPTSTVVSRLGYNEVTDQILAEPADHVAILSQGLWKTQQQLSVVYQSIYA